MVAANRERYQGKGVALKRYMSIDHIYIEKIADTVQKWCGWDEESDWLNVARDFYDKGYSWKTLYFALVSILSYSYRADDDFEINMRPCFPRGDVYHQFVKNVYQIADSLQNYTCAEEFFYNVTGGH